MPQDCRSRDYRSRGSRRQHAAAARRGARPLDVMDGDQFRQGAGLDRHRQALVAGDAGRSRRQHAGRRQPAAQRDPGHATRCCARSTRCGTPTRCARSCRSTGRRSPGRCAPSGCARWPTRQAIALGRRAERQALAVGDRRLERGRPALVGRGRPQPAERRPAPATSGSPRRNGTSNPVYRTLKEMYLLASDWLLKQGQRPRAWSEAERQRLNFHLQQFVDAMSPTLLLLSNPAALRRAMETGGASLADGARNLLDDLKEGRLSMVDADGLRAGAQPRHDAGQGGPPQPADRADPVRADDRDGARGAAADHAALDQQVLHPRHAAEEQHGRATWSSRASPSSWSPGRTPTPRWRSITFEDYMDLGPLAASDVVREITGSPTVNVDGLLHRRHAAGHDPGLAGRAGRQAVRLGDLHGLDAGLLQGRRHRASSWTSRRSTSSSSR